MRNTIRVRLNSGGLTFFQPTLKKWKRVDKETAEIFVKNVVGYSHLPYGRLFAKVKEVEGDPMVCQCGHSVSQHSERVAGEGRIGKLCLLSSCDCYHFRSSDPASVEEAKLKAKEKAAEKALKAVAGVFGLGLTLAQEGKV